MIFMFRIRITYKMTPIMECTLLFHNIQLMNIMESMKLKIIFTTVIPPIFISGIVMECIYIFILIMYIMILVIGNYMIVKINHMMIIMVDT